MEENEPPRRIYLVGRRIEYSVSPHIYNRLFESTGVNARYYLLDVDFEEFEAAAAKSLRDASCIGFNVTTPYKVRALKVLDSLSTEALEIGAVNVAVNRRGSLIGGNTDWKGFIHALTAVSRRQVFRKAVVIGAGGAARAAVYGLKGKCRLLIIASQTGRSAAELAKVAASWGFSVVEGLKASSPRLTREVAEADLVVNATPVGSLKVGGVPVPEDSLREGSVVLDMVYKPLRTPLLKAAEDRGCTVVDGLWMLVYQAVENLKLWMGVDVNPLRLRRYGLEALGGDV